MSEGVSPVRTAFFLGFSVAAALWAAHPAQAESWEARCSNFGDADLCVLAALQNSERALLAAVSERRTELRQTPGVDRRAIENAQIQWMARTQNGCAARAADAPTGDFDLVFGRCLAESYEARRVELESALN